MGRKSHRMMKRAARRKANALGGIGPRQQRYEITVIVGRGVDSLAAIVGNRFQRGTNPLAWPEKLGHALTTAEIAAGSIDGAHLVEWLKEARQRQAGAAGGTLRSAEGFYEEQSEHVTELSVKYFANDREPTWGHFETNMLRLAEDTAFAFAQKEILVNIIASGVEWIYQVSPTGFPAPGLALDDYIAEAAGFAGMLDVPRADIIGDMARRSAQFGALGAVDDDWTDGVVRIPKDGTPARDVFDLQYRAALEDRYSGPRRALVPTDDVQVAALRLTNRVANPARHAMYRRMLAADARVPPILVEDVSYTRDMTLLEVVDGNHRTQAALDEHVPTLPAILLVRH